MSFRPQWRNLYIHRHNCKQKKDFSTPLEMTKFLEKKVLQKFKQDFNKKT